LIVAAVYLTGVALFVAAFVMTGLPKSFEQVMGQARQTTNTLMDPGLDDHAKEQAARSASWIMLKTGVAITVKGALTAAVAVFPFWLAHALEIRTWKETTGFALRWDVLVGTTLAALGIWFIWRRWLAAKR
jgi:hypothetical protein